MKKVWILTLVVCILLVGIIVLVMLLPGFQRRNDVFVSDFSLLEDGKALTLQIGVAGSMGYVRKLEPIGTKDNVLLLDAYSAFGGPNGSIGAVFYQAKIFLQTSELLAWTVVVVAVSVAFEKLFMLFLRLVLKKLKMEDVLNGKRA